MPAMCRSYRLHIIGETSLAINHCLVALPGTAKADLKRVMSHPQVRQAAGARQSRRAGQSGRLFVYVPGGGSAGAGRRRKRAGAGEGSQEGLSVGGAAGRRYKWPGAAAESSGSGAQIIRYPRMTTVSHSRHSRSLRFT